MENSEEPKILPRLRRGGKSFSTENSGEPKKPRRRGGAKRRISCLTSAGALRPSSALPGRLKAGLTSAEKLFKNRKTFQKSPPRHFAWNLENPDPRYFVWKLENSPPAPQGGKPVSMAKSEEPIFP